MMSISFSVRLHTMLMLRQTISKKLKLKPIRREDKVRGAKVRTSYLNITCCPFSLLLGLVIKDLDNIHSIFER